MCRCRSYRQREKRLSLYMFKSRQYWTKECAMTTNPSSQSLISFPDFHPTPGQPAYYDQQHQAWHVFRYAQVQRVLSDYTTFSSNRGRLDPEDRGPNTASLNDLDPPRHRQMRSLVT